MLPPIFMLHHVDDEPDETLKSWCVTRKKFSLLLDYLEHNNYQTTTFADIVENKGSLQPERKKVILSFDDCPKKLFDFCIPELARRDMKASFYMPTAYIGGYNIWNVEEGMGKVELMAENDLRQLTQLGMEVGAHSHEHVKLKNKSEGEIIFQINECKSILERVISKPICSFAYPYASVPYKYAQILQEAGFKYGLSIYQSFESRYALRRIGFHEGDTNNSIKFKLSSTYKWIRAAYDPTKKY